MSVDGTRRGGGDRVVFYNRGSVSCARSGGCTFLG